MIRIWTLPLSIWNTQILYFPVILDHRFDIELSSLVRGPDHRTRRHISKPLQIQTKICTQFFITSRKDRRSCFFQYICKKTLWPGISLLIHTLNYVYVHTFKQNKKLSDPNLKNNTISIPSFRYSSKASGVTYSETGICFFVGRMYCPKVITSTPASLTSSIVLIICAGVSPQPSMIDVFVNVPGAAIALAILKTSIDCLKFAR